MIDPFVDESKIIVEAIPEKYDTEFEIYMKTMNISREEDDPENH